MSGLILTKQLTVRGFMVPRWLPRWPEAFKEMYQWIKEVCAFYSLHLLVPCSPLQGKLKYNEVVFEGFENTFDAFACLFKGSNIGKVVVKV